MTFAIAAVGTGGHVFPGLAVGEALVEAGVPRQSVLFVGGDRLEAEVYPQAGFPFFAVRLQGLSRSLSPANLLIPFTLVSAIIRMRREFRRRAVSVVLGLGGYVTVPAAVAARLAGATFMLSEQNAHAGLGNRVAGRLAKRRFGSFPVTEGLDAEWVGNPVRESLAVFDRTTIRPGALADYGLSADRPVVGIFGGSLGAGVLNRVAPAVAALPDVQVVHLAGRIHAAELATAATEHWRVIAFEDRMDRFFAASDLVVSRAGGAVAELSATGTPAVLVPGGFGSAGHQAANATYLEQAGAAVVVPEEAVDTVPEVVASILGDPTRLDAMRAAARSLARPDAARTVAAAMMAAHD
ncbi:MAG TPA: UDP-N-acetylglucosamine--N-acetylmuramyl-(pentapeptide) pyrophosphoryl-undecaprenol N-acetylglucosamine transferase [Acidimicrobiia bacterium]|nr:UDP-N-acetylglucosamine--N-acetylmuramyl-(pentapeptide) pyrophosphoryl-undecaprenol N-acetylglucosamine transferase [Acidimicrobiia bacterium]